MISEVYNCDCMEYMRSLPDKYFDLAICDPPYGGANSEIGGGQDSEDGLTDTRNLRGRFKRYQTPPIPNSPEIKVGRTDGTWATKYGKNILGWDIAPPPEFFEELFRVSTNQIIWGGNYFALPPTRCFLVWRKLTISEKFSMAMAEYAWTSFNGNAKVFEFAPQGNKETRFHPTQKPLELYAWQYNLYAKRGMKIFDPMMGSQSSRIAAYFAELDYFGCEIDHNYFVKGNARYERICKGRETIGEHTIIQQKLF